MATHTTSPKLSPAEDIGSILHRFEHWAGAHQPVDMRELSLEEALEQARSRRGAKGDFAGTTPDAVSAARPRAAAEAKVGPTPGAKAAGRTSTQRAAKAAPSNDRSRAGKATKGRPTPKPQTKAAGLSASGAKRATTAHSFQQALEREIARPRAAKSPAELLPADTVELTSRPANTAAAVSLSVKMSVADRNTIRSRAQSLGLTPGAYLRQCALEVESLRAEVQQLVLNRAQSASRTLPAGPKPNWLARLRSYFAAQTGDRQTAVYRGLKAEQWSWDRADSPHKPSQA